MGYLYVFQNDKTDEKITLGSVERRKEFRALVERFKETIRNMSFERINAEDVKVCHLNQSFLKNKYSIDSSGCARLAYKDILTLLNDIRIQASALPPVTTSSGSTTATGTLSAKPSTTSRSNTATSKDVGRSIE